MTNAQWSKQVIVYHIMIERFAGLKSNRKEIKAAFPQAVLIGEAWLEGIRFLFECKNDIEKLKFAATVQFQNKYKIQVEFNMTIKDLDDKLLNVFNDCPYKGKRKECTFAEMRDVEIDERFDSLEKMDENEKVTKWQRHLECFMNAIAR